MGEEELEGREKEEGERGREEGGLGELGRGVGSEVEGKVRGCQQP